MELLFQQGERARRVTVTVAGDGAHYRVDTAGLAGKARKVARTPGWHRLIVQFRKQSLRLTCDDDVLWYNLEEGPGSPLRRVTIACQRAPESKAPRGAVAWTEFCIERAVVEHRPPPAEDEQDAVRLRDDDQLFGRILRADRRTIEIEGRFGKRSLPWTAVSGCSFRRPAAPPNANKGAKVRLLVRSGLCPESDVLEGVVTATRRTTAGIAACTARRTDVQAWPSARAAAVAGRLEVRDNGRTRDFLFQRVERAGR